MKTKLKKNKIRVLFVSDRVLLGGAELFLLDLLPYLEQYIDPVFLFSKKGPLTNLLKDRPQIYFSQLKFNLRLFKNDFDKILDLILKWRKAIDLVYVNSAYVNRTGLLLARLLGAKEVVHIHSFVEKKELLKDKYRFRYSNRIICSSRSLYKQISDVIDNGKLVCIYPGIIASKFVYSANIHNPLELCLVGRISKLKRQDLFIKLAAYFPECNFHIVGAVEDEKDYLNYIKELVRTCEIKNVFFHEFVHNIPKFLREMDILISMSEEESFGRVFLEAMASGVLVMASFTKGAGELIKDKENGIIVKQNDINSWQNALAWVLKHKSLVLSIKEKAKDYVRSHYDLATISHQWLNLVHNLLL